MSIELTAEDFNTSVWEDAMRTCLIVTSEPDTQREFCAMVRMLGFNAVSALSVGSAVDKLRNSPAVVIVIDEWWRSGEDPQSFMRRVPTLKRPPIVVVQKVRLSGIGNGCFTSCALPFGLVTTSRTAMNDV